MKIIYPKDEQINDSILYICDKGLPPKENMAVFLKNMTANLGPNNIFHGTYDALIIAIFVCISLDIALFFLMKSSLFTEEKLFAFAFAGSPLMFMLMFILSYIKEKTNDTYIIKMSFKYTVNHLIAYRMFVFSLFSILFNTAYIILLSVELSLSILSILSISFSSLFIFSMLLILIILKYDSVLSPIILSVSWIFVNALLFFFALPDYGSFLKTVPILIWLLISIICILVYVNRLALFINKRENSYAS